MLRIGEPFDVWIANCYLLGEDREHHELISLFRFSLRFNRSTRFLCIFASSCSYRSFSSFFARFSLMAAIRA